jgi:hypothetical protein
MSTETETVKQLIAAEAAANELTTTYDKVARTQAFIHHRTNNVTITIEVTDWSVMQEIPLTDGKFKGFDIIWGYYIPDGVAIQ